VATAVKRADLPLFQNNDRFFLKMPVAFWITNSIAPDAVRCVWRPVLFLSSAFPTILANNPADGPRHGKLYFNGG
jgi:hypothetical protein